jgi:hypothetical protein
VWLTDATIGGLDVRLVRRMNDFNVSDLLEAREPSRRTIDLTVDRLALSGGKIVMEDQAHREPRTWTSEQIEIEAHGLSTVKGGGTATARSITAGAPVSLDMRDVRLAPIHLEAVVTTTGLDIGLAPQHLELGLGGRDGLLPGCGVGFLGERARQFLPQRDVMPAGHIGGHQHQPLERIGGSRCAQANRRNPLPLHCQHDLGADAFDHGRRPFVRQRQRSHAGFHHAVLVGQRRPDLRPAQVHA